MKKGIIGAGGFGREVYWSLSLIERVDELVQETATIEKSTRKSRQIGNIRGIIPASIAIPVPYPETDLQHDKENIARGI